MQFPPFQGSVDWKVESVCPKGGGDFLGYILF